MDEILANVRRAVAQAVQALQRGESSSDVFFAMHCVAFLPECPTSPRAVVDISPRIVDTIVEDVFRQSVDANNNNTSPRSASFGGGGNSNNGPNGTVPVISSMAAEHSKQPSSATGANANATTAEWARLVSRLAFSRLVELHLALSPSPFQSKSSWYAAAKSLVSFTENSLLVAHALLKKAVSSPHVGLAGSVIAVCAAVLLRALHVDHVVENLRVADAFLCSSLKRLEVQGRHARDMFALCNAARSIDQLALHCPFVVVIIAAVMDKLPAQRQVEKDRREEHYASLLPHVRAAEEARLAARLRDEASRGGASAASSSWSSINAQDNSSSGVQQQAPPETMVEWTHYMLNSDAAPSSSSGVNNFLVGGGDASSSPAVMGGIPRGILAAAADLGDVGGDSSADSDAAAPPQGGGKSVATFVKMFIAARLAFEQIDQAHMAGSAENAYNNAARAFALCPPAYATPFAEVAAVARLRMGDVPSAPGETLRTLGATVLDDVALALRCGHLAAFDAAVSDASGELHARGLLAAVMTLRTHATMMMVRKFLCGPAGDGADAKRLDLETFFARYRNQLPSSLLDTEMQLLAPLILGKRVRARLQHQTLALAQDAFVFDT